MKILSNEVYACDRCRRTPSEDAEMQQIQKQDKIYIYCIDCWAKFKSLLK